MLGEHPVIPLLRRQKLTFCSRPNKKEKVHKNY